MLVELTMHRNAKPPHGDSPIDGIRILALLPKHWRKDLVQATGDISIRVQTDDDTAVADVRAAISAILEDPIFSYLTLAYCDRIYPYPRANSGNTL